MATTDTDPDFDTLAYARGLREAGVPGKQAEAHAEAARTIRAGLATKADLDAGLNGLETRLDARLTALETRSNARIDTRIADLRADIYRVRADIYRALWVQTGAFVAVMTALIAAFKLFG